MESRFCGYLFIHFLPQVISSLFAVGILSVIN